jgi:hypothetical protein
MLLQVVLVVFLGNLYIYLIELALVQLKILNQRGRNWFDLLLDFFIS